MSSDNFTGSMRYVSVLVVVFPLFGFLAISVHALRAFLCTGTGWGWNMQACQTVRLEKGINGDFGAKERSTGKSKSEGIQH